MGLKCRERDVFKAISRNFTFVKLVLDQSLAYPESSPLLDLENLVNSEWNLNWNFDLFIRQKMFKNTVQTALQMGFFLYPDSGQDSGGVFKNWL